MDQLSRKGPPQTVQQILPDGMSQDDVEAELKEIRDRFASKRRLSWIYFFGMVFVGWQIFSSRSLTVLAVWVGVLLASMVALTRLGHRKMERLEQRGAFVIEEGQVRDRLPDSAEGANDGRGSDT